MSNHWIIVFLSFFSINLCSSQDYTSKELTIFVDSLTQLKKATKVELLKAEKYISQYDTITNAKQLGIAYHNIGKLYYKNDNKKAIELTKKAIRFKRQAKDTFEAHRSINNLYYFNDELPKKIKYLKKIINDKSYNKYSLRAHNNIANIYIKKGDYHKALEHYDYVIESYKAKHFDTERLVMAHLGSIGVYLKIKINSEQFHKVEYHNQEIEKYIQKIKNKKFDIELNTAKKNHNLAIIYSDLNRNEDAITYYNKALSHYLRIEENIDAGNVYNNLGVIYSELKENKKAAQYYKKALKITTDKFVTSRVSHNQGFFLKTDNPIDKIPYYQKSIALLLEDTYQDNSLEKLPLVKTIGKPEYAVEILEDLIQIANAWVLEFKKNKGISNLENAKKTIYLIDELISYIRFTSSVSQSKLFWINKGVDTYMLGVEASYLLNDVESALYFMEKNKALLLLENLNTVPVKKLNITTLDSIRKTHVSNTSNFVEYILNDNTGYGIFSSNTETEFFKIDKVNELLQEVRTLKIQSQKPFSNKADGFEYAKNANRIFKKLFPFKDALQKISNKKLTIVSDYVIKNLPFEALVTNSSSIDITKDFLINKTEMSYLYSASVLAQIQKNKYNPKRTVLGIAPKIFTVDGLTTLEQSTEDMDVIASYFPITILKSEEATKDTVLSAINDYKVIHFNTHAGLDDNTQEPWLALNDQKVYLQELYNVPNQADLVVLDACKSATGKLEIGEGVMSLSRGFTYNGAKSVIASQWNANEKAISSIFKTFYKELSQGKSKSRALHNAKITYLNTHQLSEISPYYWASMMLTGDTNSLKINGTSYTWTLYLLVAIIIIAVYFFYRKK